MPHMNLIRFETEATTRHGDVVRAYDCDALVSQEGVSRHLPPKSCTPFLSKHHERLRS